MKRCRTFIALLSHWMRSRENYDDDSFEYLHISEFRMWCGIIIIEKCGLRMPSNITCGSFRIEKDSKQMFVFFQKYEFHLASPRPPPVLIEIVLHKIFIGIFPYSEFIYAEKSMFILLKELSFVSYSNPSILNIFS